MDKETEELVIFGVIGFFLIILLTNSTGSANALGLAKIQGATDSTYANDAAGVVESLAGDF